MTPVLYRDTARKNLKDIETYFSAFSESAFNNVMKDINSSLTALQIFPEAGSPLSNNRRRIATTRYKFVISYLSKGEAIEVLGIHRYQNR